MSDNLPIPAAEYLRMSTDEQQLSFAYQAATIKRYAQQHNFRVSRTYRDSGKSGLTLKRRKGLTQLLEDVASGRHDFKVILVYDVSRWGRFQDTDESAHYEFLCRSAGVPVHFCAEPFKNNTSSPAVLMKNLKRLMAAEYSRELSVRIIRTKKILTERGYRVGGAAGYGLRRMLLSPEGIPKRLLALGEVKDIPTGRVILVPGPTNEVNTVREIYRLRTLKLESCDGIATGLNQKGIPHPSVPWDGGHVRVILENPKYMGCATWRRTTGPLGAREVAVPPEQWVRKDGAFEAIIDPETYEKAQRIRRELTLHKSNERLLGELRSLLKREKRISEHLIDQSLHMAGSLTYVRRFGSLKHAYSLIGYNEDRNMRQVRQTRRQVLQLRRTLFKQILKTFKKQVTAIQERVGSRQALRFEDGVKLSVAICRCVEYGFGPRWVIPVNRFEKNYPTLICRCTKDNKSLMDMYLVKRMDRSCATTFLAKLRDPWLERGKRIRNLASLRKTVARLIATSAG